MKTILITGATDGIGLLTAKTLAAKGHTILLHGRNAEKLKAARQEVGSECETFQSDFSSLPDVRRMVDDVGARYSNLDVLINNAGVLKTPNPVLENGLDIRFVVNTLAPFVLAHGLLSSIPEDGRILNLSSAAQAPINIDALNGNGSLDDMSAYAQSKLALTIWSNELAKMLPDGPVVIAVNPGSLLATKMVQEGFGLAGNDLAIGSDILCDLALDNRFADDSGKYWDNDSGGFASPHSAAADPIHVNAVMAAIRGLVG